MRSNFIAQEIAQRIQSRQLSFVQSIWKRAGRDDRRWRNEKGQSFLHIALTYYQMDIFDWLYEHLENDAVILSLDNEDRSVVGWRRKNAIQSMSCAS